MKKIFLTLIMLLMALAVFGDDNFGFSDGRNHFNSGDRMNPLNQPSYCQNIYDVYTCATTPNCFWNEYINRCDDERRRGGNDRSCRMFNSEFSCERQSDCRWDNHFQYCEDRWDSDRDNGRGQNCSQIYNPNMCERSPNCDWNRYANRCEFRGRPIPGPRPPRPQPPMECRYINSEYQCLNTRGCAWDSIRHFCQINPFVR